MRTREQLEQIMRYFSLLVLVYGAFPPIPLFRRALVKQLHLAALAGFRRDRRRALDLLTQKLQDSSTPAKSVLLIWLLENAVRAAPSDPIFKSVLSDLPGNDPLQRLSCCREVMRMCFSRSLLCEHLLDRFDDFQF